MLVLGLASNDGARKTAARPRAQNIFKVVVVYMGTCSEVDRRVTVWQIVSGQNSSMRHVRIRRVSIILKK